LGRRQHVAADDLGEHGVVDGAAHARPPSMTTAPEAVPRATWPGHTAMVAPGRSMTKGPATSSPAAKPARTGVATGGPPGSQRTSRQRSGPDPATSPRVALASGAPAPGRGTATLARKVRHSSGAPSKA